MIMINETYTNLYGLVNYDYHFIDDWILDISTRIGYWIVVHVLDISQFKTFSVRGSARKSFIVYWNVYGRMELVFSRKKICIYT